MQKDYNTVGKSIEITIEQTTESRLPLVDLDDPGFGKHYSDHMLVADYENGKWTKVTIMPYQNFSLSPATSAIHYGQSIFEGMKAYKNQAGEAVIFRPEENWKRLNESATRMMMPEVPEEVFMDGLKSLIQVDSDWVPSKLGNSLYIRPFLFATDAYVGIKPSDNYRFAIITSPVGAYYSNPVNVLVSDYYVRAFEGGTGAAKAAGNYGATMRPMMEAKAKGFDQVLWMDPRGFKEIQEIGTMNVMFEINGKLITPSDEKGDILKGITRKSVVELAKHKGITVEERVITIDEVVDAFNNGTLTDAFGLGTAATIAPIASIQYGETKITLPELDKRTTSNSIRKEMDAIKYGINPDPFNWIKKA